MSSVFYRNQLKTKQATIFYDSIIKEIEKGNVSGEYRLHPIDYESASRDAFEAIKAIRYDRPDIFFLGFRNETYMIGNKYFEIKNSVLCDEHQVHRVQRLLDVILHELTKDLYGASELEREKQIYTRIRRLVKYDDKGDEIDHNVMGPILRRTAVCEGYTCILMLALRKVGIRCIRISGVGRFEKHCWIMAWINGTPYHLDVTWEGISLGRVGNRYFNLTDRQISKDHLISTKGLPRCNVIFNTDV